MPNMDNTGPEGMGPTGRGLGSCPNKSNLFTSRVGRARRGFANRGQGRGCAFGIGGTGAGRFFKFSKKDERLFLKEEIKAREEQLELMKNRLEEIDE